MINPNGLLMIEPEGTHIPDEPLIDELTRRVMAALLKCSVVNAWMGKHQCVCGETSGSVDLIVAGGRMTNSLAVHYMAWHRADVPREELAKVLLLPEEYANPTEAALARPKRTGLAFQAWLEAQRKVGRLAHNSQFDTAWLTRTTPRFFDIGTVKTSADSMLKHLTFDKKKKEP